jgi:acyl carrier protein
LPALAVNWTAVADVGYLARHAAVRTHLEKRGLAALPARQLLQVLGALLQHGAVQTAVLRSDALQGGLHLLGALSPRFAGVARTPAPRTDAGLGGHARQSLRDLLRACAGPERQDLLKTALREQIGKALGLPAANVDPDQPLTSLGLESLLAIELGTRLKKELGVEIPIMKLLRGVTLNNLVHDLLQIDDAEEVTGTNGDQAAPVRARRPALPDAWQLSPAVGRDAATDTRQEDARPGPG